ncbi:hypothetical protein EIQ02_19575 [Xanthomonas campestris pv. raphani]
MARYCQGIENMTLRSEAKRQGRPAASDSITTLYSQGNRYHVANTILSLYWSSGSSHQDHHERRTKS